MFKTSIQSITKPLSKMVSQLDTLVDTQTKERNFNQDKINQLVERNTEIMASNSQANNIKNNISKLLGDITYEKD